MQKTERLLAITLLLQARGKMTADRLAGILGVSVRTIYRDMDALSLAHVPVSMDYGPGGGYFLADTYRVDGASFTGDEAVALALGGALAGGSHLFERDDGLRRALLTLEAVLPEEFRSDIRAARDRVLLDTAAWYQDPPMAGPVETVRAAVWGERQLDLLYPRSDAAGAEWRRVEPHGLVYKAGTWYLVAYCLRRRDFRTFRVNRIEAAEIRDEAVTPRPDFDLRTYWTEARQRFEERAMPFSLTVRASQAGLRRLRAGEIIERAPDGSAVVRIGQQSEEAAIRFALALGTDAVVLDPPAVRREVARIAELVAYTYLSRDEMSLAAATASSAVSDESERVLSRHLP